MFVDLIEGPTLTALTTFKTVVNFRGAFGVQSVCNASFLGLSVGKAHIFLHISNVCALVHL
jgi:hypothetical protein